MSDKEAALIRAKLLKRTTGVTAVLVFGGFSGLVASHAVHATAAGSTTATPTTTQAVVSNSQGGDDSQNGGGFFGQSSGTFGFGQSTTSQQPAFQSSASGF